MGAGANAGMAMTVEGPVNPENLGVTSTHEHVVIDLRSWQLAARTQRQREIAEDALRMDMLGEVRRDLLVFPDALVLGDLATQADEVRDFREAGGKTIVEVTVEGLGPNPSRIREIGRQAGVQFVVGVGYYPVPHVDMYPGRQRPSRPPDKEIQEQSEKDLAESMIRVITDGFDDSGIRPGIIGSFGTRQPAQADEWKILTAACSAQKETGLPLFVDSYWGPRRGNGPEIVKHILGQGVDPGRVNIAHMDSTVDIAYQLAVLEMGVSIGIDMFGVELYYDSLMGDQHLPHDTDREYILLELIERGYESQIVLGQDVYCKIQLRRYGGYGYGHLLSHIIPSLEHQGVDQATIQRLVVENPRRLLTIG
jgi:phosphotriesterase-related protein